jgi:hypothetical protein
LFKIEIVPNDAEKKLDSNANVDLRVQFIHKQGEKMINAISVDRFHKFRCIFFLSNTGSKYSSRMG